MIKEYLKHLKTSGNFSWQDISRTSGLPEATIRKIFSGETPDPRFETVARLVRAMGGSLNQLNDIENAEQSIKSEKTEDAQIKSLTAVKELYEERIKEIKESSAEQVHSLKRDKKILAVTVGILASVLLGILLLDLCVGSAGWIQY